MNTGKLVKGKSSSLLVYFDPFSGDVFGHQPSVFINSVAIFVLTEQWN